MRVATPTRSALAAALAAVLALALSAPAAGAADARYEGSSADGSVVFFTTDEAPALLGDTDLKSDVYMRSFDPTPGIEDFVTRKVSTGPEGGNSALDAFFAGASHDGKLAFFSTRESLVAADTDRAADLYRRDLAANTTALVSAGDPSCAPQGCGNAEVNVSFVLRGVTGDGSRAFFMTGEALSPDDVDATADVYVRDLEAGTTALVSAGDPSCAPQGCGTGNVPVLSFEDGSDDGTRVVFRSEEKLATADVDGGQADLYQRDLEAGTTRLVSLPGTCPVASCVPTYGGSSAGGTHVIFETVDRIVGGDTDSSQDVYEWSEGAASLVSTGPAGGNGPEAATFPGVVSGFPGVSAGGDRVFFETDERLVGADADDANDVYERSSGVTALVSRRDASCEPLGCGGDELPASFRWISPDGSGSAAIFGSGERLSSADADAAQDVYQRSAGATTLLSAGAFGGNEDLNASFAGASHDGSHVFVLTTERLDPLDNDSSSDIYDVSGAAATLVSTGPMGGNGPFGSGLTGVSESGSHAFFATDERLTVDDKDGEERDVYQRTATGTLLVSTGNSVLLGPPPPTQLSTDPASPGESKTPSIRGQADAGGAIQVYTNPSCSGEPVKTGTAEALTGAGIQVTVATGSNNSFWLTAEAEGITSPCAGPVVYKHAGAPSPGGEPDGKPGGGSGPGPGGSGKPGGGGASYVTPKTRITFGPSFKTKRRKAVFRFTDSTGQPGTRFLCRLDRRRWRGCGSPIKLTRLGKGRHLFRVKAVNAAGEWETRPARHAFKVVAP